MDKETLIAKVDKKIKRQAQKKGEKLMYSLTGVVVLLLKKWVEGEIELTPADYAVYIRDMRDTRQKLSRYGQLLKKLKRTEYEEKLSTLN